MLSPWVYPICMASLADFRTAELLSERGLDLLESGRPVEAAQAFRAAILSNEKNLEAHFGLVRALRDADRLEQSIRAALALTALNPHDPAAHIELSISLEQAGHVKEAEGAVAKARIVRWAQDLQAPHQETWIN